MNLQDEFFKEHFKDIPIEFKEINPSDFKSKGCFFGKRKNGFEVENNKEKIIISPNKDGYINESFQSNIYLNNKNTVVLNAAVGQGKSYAIIQTIKEYYKAKKDYQIIVASPFVSLVKQYCLDIHKDAGIPENEIFDYNELGRNPNPKYINKFVQVVTVNTLLGNPGEDGFKNSDIKRKYLDELIDYCTKAEKKVVFIYDEIHDSYHNFKEKYIFNLWKWHSIIHKNFILSATFNEASKIVIEYLAELTDRKIRIIESERVRFPKKQSSLYLHYSPSHWFKYNTPEIKQLIKKLVDRGKNIDVLCYSKRLAKGLINPKEDTGKLLLETYGEVKDCTSELIFGQRPENEDAKNQFDNNKCNVGTNFKTGVSLKKKNHAFVIIMPPRASRMWFKNNYGIFSGGVNSFIQAIARQRLKGEIHVILPNPDWFDFKSLDRTSMNKIQKTRFEELYKNIQYYKKPDNLVQYFPFKVQDHILRDFYKKKLKGNVEKEVTHIKKIDRVGLAKLEFPNYKQFKLENGEDFLANDKEHSFFGDDISAYITYSAITNQFVNCNLKEINIKPPLFFRKNSIQKALQNYYKQYFSYDHFHTLGQFSNFSLFFNDIRDELFNSYNLKYKKTKDSKWEQIQPHSSLTKVFEVELIKFVAKMYYVSSYNKKSKIFYNKEYFKLTRGKYFLDNISLSKDKDTESSNYPLELKRKYKLFQIISHFRKKLIDKVEEINISGFHYMYLKRTMPDNFFNERDSILLNELISLIKYDELLENDIFEFKRNLTLKSLYKKLIEDFFETKEYKTPLTVNRRRPLVRKIIAIKTLPPFSSEIINLIEPQEYFLEHFFNEEDS